MNACKEVCECDSNGSRSEIEQFSADKLESWLISASV